MAAIPNKRAVSQALKSTRRALKQTIKEINQSAADLAQKGNYERAEAAMTKGRELMHFREEIASVEQKWKQVCGSGKAPNEASGEVSLAAWQYYAPIVRSLVALGGKASLSDLEAEFLRQMNLISGSATVPIWQAAGNVGRSWIGRARNTWSKRAGSLSRSSKLWEITAAGRQVQKSRANKPWPVLAV